MGFLATKIMKIIVPKITNLLASNVTEELFDLWDTATPYVAGNRKYIYYSDFDELITYGDCVFNQFEISLFPEWTYDGNALEYDCDGTQTGVTQLYQKTDKVEFEDEYLVQFEIKNWAAGAASPYVQGTTGTGKGADGVYQEIIIAGSSNTKIGIEANASFVGSITNISIKRIGEYHSKNIYEAQQGTTGDFPPDDNGTNWIKVSASNRWKMFDKYINSQTVNSEKISVKLKANKCDSFAFFLTEATNIRYALLNDSVTETSLDSIAISKGSKSFNMTNANHDWVVGAYVEIYQTSDQKEFMLGQITAWNQSTGAITVLVDYAEGSGSHSDWTIVYIQDYETEKLILEECLSWKDYFYKPIRFSNSKSKTYTMYFNTSLRVIFTGSGTVRVGHLLVGTSIYIGKTQYGIKGGIKDYSTKEINDFGEQYIYERDYSKKPSYEVYIAKGGEDQVFQTLSQLRATLCVFDGNNDSSDFSFTVAYGILSDWELSKDGFNETYLDLEILGST